MILKTDRQQRNYNYLELIRMYNSALEKYHHNAILSYNEYTKIENDLSVSLIGLESVEEIKNSLSSNEDNSLNLFYKEDEKYFFEKENKILPVASKEEALIVYSMLKNGDFDLFLNENQKKIINNNIKKYFENINEKPFDLYDFIEVKGESLCADKLIEIKDYFYVLKKAIELKSLVKISYYYDDKIEDSIVQPIEFIYSQLDFRLRVKAFFRDGGCRTFYISNIKKLEILENEKPFTQYEKEQNNTNELVFSFENNSSKTERIAARFSDYKKEIHYNKKNNMLTYHVFYADTPTENNRIIYRLRSLGKGITILSEEKERVKQDALKALENYRN